VKREISAQLFIFYPSNAISIS